MNHRFETKNYTHQQFQICTLIFSIAVLSACGGGGSEQPSNGEKSARLDVSAPVDPDPTSTVPAWSDMDATAEEYMQQTNEVTNVVECQIAPSQTAASGASMIKDSYGNHCVYRASGNPQKLFVFLGASSSNPSSYTYIGKAAKSAGLHSIGLAYVNMTTSGSTVQGTCNNLAQTNPTLSPQCTGDIREEQLLGNPTSDFIDVNAANSLNNRLYSLLSYLNFHYPSEHWSNFIVGGAVRWTKVSIGGLSQGSGLAGYTGKRKGVGRVCMFSGPADFDNADPNNGKPAAWVSSPSQTSPSLMYAFDSTQDNIVKYTTNAIPNWNALGLTGADTNVDTTVSPYGNSHRLTTASINVSSPHTSTAKDDTTPITFPPAPAASSPTYAPVWSYTCF